MRFGSRLVLLWFVIVLNADVRAGKAKMDAQAGAMALGVTLWKCLARKNWKEQKL